MPTKHLVFGVSQVLLAGALVSGGCDKSSSTGASAQSPEVMVHVNPGPCGSGQSADKDDCYEVPEAQGAAKPVAPEEGPGEGDGVVGEPPATPPEPPESSDEAHKARDQIKVNPGPHRPEPETIKPNCELGQTPAEHDCVEVKTKPPKRDPSPKPKPPIRVNPGPYQPSPSKDL
jgi:hypothetical protein